MKLFTTIFSDEIAEYIKENVTGRSAIELTELVNNKFGTDYKVNQIKSYKKNHKLNSGWRNWYSEGNIPHNKLPIGSEYKNNEGYTYIKIAEPNTWIGKQKYIWEQHYGKISKGYSVIFLDQNKTNFDINNLALIKNGTKLAMKCRGLFSKDAEATKTGIMVADLIIKTAKKK